jgi:hypothetical protein
MGPCEKTPECPGAYGVIKTLLALFWRCGKLVSKSTRKANLDGRISAIFKSLIGDQDNGFFSTF